MTRSSHFDAELGAAIRDARLDAGHTQEELARALGVSPGTIARYELGIRKIPVGTLLQIASALRQPLSRLVPGAERLEPAVVPAPATPSDQALQTVVRVMEQRPDLVSKVLQVLEEALAAESEAMSEG